MDINIQLIMDYYVPFGQKHISGTAIITSANNIGSRTCFPTGMQPKIMLAEIGTYEKLMDIVELDQIEWTALDYNKTFLKKAKEMGFKTIEGGIEKLNIIRILIKALKNGTIDINKYSSLDKPYAYGCYKFLKI